MNHYVILEISTTASFDEIKDAYRRLAKQHHPDLNNGSDESVAKFKAINEAFYVLNDPLRRAKYDSLQFINRPASTKAEKRAENIRKNRKNPLNFTIDVDVGEVDLWAQTFARLKDEEIDDQRKQKIAREQAKLRQKLRQKVKNERVDLKGKHKRAKWWEAWDIIDP